MSELISPPRYLLDILHTHIAKRKRALEIGCGNGAKSYLLSLLFKKYIAVDHNKDAIDIAIKNKPPLMSNLTFNVESLANLNYEKKFNVIFMFNVFHFTKWHHAILQIKKLLKKDGICIIREPQIMPKNWANNVLNQSSEKFNEVKWLDKKKLLEDEHSFLMHLENYKLKTEYLENYRMYIIKKI